MKTAGRRLVESPNRVLCDATNGICIAARPVSSNPDQAAKLVERESASQLTNSAFI